MDLVQDEISHFSEYDYVVFNKDLSECIDKIKKIIEAEG